MSSLGSVASLIFFFFSFFLTRTALFLQQAEIAFVWPSNQTRNARALISPDQVTTLIQPQVTAGYNPRTATSNSRLQPSYSHRWQQVATYNPHIPPGNSRLQPSKAGLWIRIHFMRIRIQQFFWMRSRSSLTKFEEKESKKIFFSCKKPKSKKQWSLCKFT